MKTFTRPLRKLQLEWTGRVERIDGEMLPVWEGVSPEGERIRVYIKKFEDIDEHEEKLQRFICDL